MTWLKLRSAAGLTAGFVLVAGAIAFTAVAAGSRAKAPDIQGTWEGMADLGAGAEGKSQKLTIVLRFNKTKDGYGATADEVEVGQANLPIEHVTYNYPVVHLDYTTLKSFTGTINTNVTEMTFNEGDIHIVLKRTEHPTPVPEKLADEEFAPRADFPLQGYWKGKLGTLPLAWKIARQANGTFRAELDNPNQGANGQPATVVFDPPNVELRLLTGESIYRAGLSTNQDELTGNWLNAGGSTPMTVRRAEYEAELAKERGRDFSPTSASDVRGHWMSVAKIGDKALRAYLDIASLPDGSYYACIRCPDFSNPGVIPATTFQCTPPKLHGEWKWIQSGIVLDCELVHSRLVGSVRLNDTDFPVTFERIKAVAAR